MNPFIVNSEFNLRAISVYTKSITTTGTYKIVETTQKVLVEEQKKVSVYKTGNSKVFTSFLFKGLSYPGRELYLYLVCNIGENTDQIKLQPEEVMSITGVSRNTFYKGLNCLKDNFIITPAKRATYWINPFFIFRGDRIKYYSEQCPGCIKIVATTSTGDKLTDALKAS